LTGKSRCGVTIGVFIHLRARCRNELRGKLWKQKIADSSVTWRNLSVLCSVFQFIDSFFPWITFASADSGEYIDVSCKHRVGPAQCVDSATKDCKMAVAQALGDAFLTVKRMR
jgi:hypothetical protein